MYCATKAGDETLRKHHKFGPFSSSSSTQHSSAFSASTHVFKPWSGSRYEQVPLVLFDQMPVSYGVCSIRIAKKTLPERLHVVTEYISLFGRVVLRGPFLSGAAARRHSRPPLEQPEREKAKWDF